MNQNEILASIIVPFHNEETHLSDAVASVLEQDHPIVELILVDDRSTDGSLELAQSLASEHPNIVLASSTRKPGPAGTRNSGLQLATGRVITYLDGDDLMVPGRVSSFIAYLIEHDSSDVVIGMEELLVESGVSLPPPLKNSRSGQRNNYTMTMMHWATLLDVVGGFDEQFDAGEDGDIVWRAKASGCRVDLIDQLATIRRIHGANLTYHKSENAIKSVAMALQRDRAGLGHKVSLDTGTAPIVRKAPE